MQYVLQYNLAVKANAVAKLTYLQMLGYDISWAGFNIIEVIMSVKRSTNTYIISVSSLYAFAPGSTGVEFVLLSGCLLFS